MDLKVLLDRLIDKFVPEDIRQKAKEARKALVVAIGSALTVLTFIVGKAWLPEKLKTPVAALIGILTTALTYLIPNDPSTLPADFSTA